MVVKFGENDVKIVEDFVGLVIDDLCGWFEIKNGECVCELGILEDYNLFVDDVEMMIMWVCVVVGWILEEDLLVCEVEEEVVEDVLVGEFDIFEMDLEVLEVEVEVFGFDFNEFLVE